MAAQILPSHVCMKFNFADGKLPQMSLKKRHLGRKERQKKKTIHIIFTASLNSFKNVLRPMEGYFYHSFMLGFL